MATVTAGSSTTLSLNADDTIMIITYNGVKGRFVVSPAPNEAISYANPDNYNFGPQPLNTTYGPYGVPTTFTLTATIGTVTYTVTAGGGGGGTIIESATPVNATVGASPLATGVAFTSTDADWVVVANQWHLDLEFQIGGAGAWMRLNVGVEVTIPVTANADEITFRRFDQATGATSFYDGVNFAFPTFILNGTAYTGVRKWASATIVEGTVLTTGNTFRQFGAAACDYVCLINQQNVGLRYRIGSASATETQVLRPNETRMVKVANSNEIYVARQLGSSAGSFDTLVSAMAMTLASGKSVTDVDARVGVINGALAHHISDQASIGMPISTGQSETDDSMFPLPMLAAFADTFRPHRRVAKKVMALFDVAANITSSADAPVDTTPVYQIEPAYVGATIPRISFTSTSTRTYAQTALPGGSVDMTAGRMHFTMRVPFGASNLNNVKLQLFSSGNPGAVPADYHEITDGDGNGFCGKFNWYCAGTVGTWGAPLSAFSAVGGGATTTAITWVRLSIQAISATLSKLDLMEIAYVPNLLNKAVCVLTFDDDIWSPWINAFPRMHRYGFPGVIFVSPAYNVGDSNPASPTLMTQRHHRLLQDHFGWQIASQEHGGGTEPGASASSYDQMSEIAKRHAVFKRNGYMGGADGSFHGSWQAAGTALAPKENTLYNAKKFVRTLRTFGGHVVGYDAPSDPFGLGFPFYDPWRMRAMDMAAYSDQAAGPIADIDQAIADKGVFIMANHGITSAGHITNWNATMDYLDANRSTIEVMTFDDLAEINYAAMGKRMLA